MTRVLLALAALFALIGIDPAAAQGRGRPGDFDLWVLSLSWSPTYCETSGRPNEPQCVRPFAFVVHGLWPQYERGYPSDCDTRMQPPSRREVQAMLDVMPSPGLIAHEWRSHGTCSGLAADAYLRVIRKVFETVRIPEAFRDATKPRMVSTREVEQAFVAANRGLDANEIAVQCDGRRLKEVRICLKKDLSAFTSCGETDRRACRLDRVYLPAIRGGAN